MALRRRRTNAPEKPPEPEGKTHLVDASTWADSRVKSFLKSAVRWLTDSDKNHLFFLTFCHERSVFRKDLLQWANRSESISGMIQSCWESEQFKLSKMAACGRIQPSYAMFHLKSQHRWKEYQTVEHQGVVVMQHDLRDLVE